MRPRLLVLMLLGSILGGCVQEAPQDPGVDEPGTRDAPFALEADATGCREVALVLLEDRARLQEALPARFEARDAGELTGAPAPTGQGVVELGAAVCEESSLQPGGVGLGFLLVLVEPPVIPGVELEPANTVWYTLAYHTSSAREAAALAAVGWPAFASNATVDLAPTPVDGAGRGEVVDAAGVAFNVEAAGTFEGRVDENLLRAWHDTPEGLAYTEYRARDVHGYAGHAGTCTIREGTPAHDLLGRTTCGTAFAVEVDDALDWRIVHRHLPDAQAARP